MSEGAPQELPPNQPLEHAAVVAAGEADPCIEHKSINSLDNYTAS